MATMTHTCPACKKRVIETTWPYKKKFSKADVALIQAEKCGNCTLCERCGNAAHKLGEWCPVVAR